MNMNENAVRQEIADRGHGMTPSERVLVNNLEQRNTGYQDAMHDLQEVIQKTDVRTGVAIWLAHGRNWRDCIE